ncbi:MAG TPA: hypothetical protein PKD85_13075 [Saprospiraceae bacterium]|nr:hypothetical protein [Saprospiraceae bacterium]
MEYLRHELKVTKEELEKVKAEHVELKGLLEEPRDKKRVATVLFHIHKTLTEKQRV